MIKASMIPVFDGVVDSYLDIRTNACPQCGAVHENVETALVLNIDGTYRMPEYSLVCPVCGFEGPGVEASYDEKGAFLAAEAWNRIPEYFGFDEEE